MNKEDKLLTKIILGTLGKTFGLYLISFTISSNIYTYIANKTNMEQLSSKEVNIFIKQQKEMPLSIFYTPGRYFACRDYEKIKMKPSN